MRVHIAVFYLLFLTLFSALFIETSLANLRMAAEPAAYPAPEMAAEYADINEKYFDSKLPKDTEVMWSRQLAVMGDMGLTITDGERFTIFLDIQMKEIGYERASTEVLIHEICHVAVFPYEEHGDPFQNCMSRLAKAGALADVW